MGSFGLAFIVLYLSGPYQAFFAIAQPIVIQAVIITIVDDVGQSIELVYQKIHSHFPARHKIKRNWFFMLFFYPE